MASFPLQSAAQFVFSDEESLRLALSWDEARRSLIYESQAQQKRRIWEAESEEAQNQRALEKMLRPRLSRIVFAVPSYVLAQRLSTFWQFPSARGSIHKPRSGEGWLVGFHDVPGGGLSALQAEIEKLEFNLEEPQLRLKILDLTGTDLNIVRLGLSCCVELPLPAREYDSVRAFWQAPFPSLPGRIRWQPLRLDDRRLDSRTLGLLAAHHLWRVEVVLHGALPVETKECGAAFRELTRLFLQSAEWQAGPVPLWLRCARDCHVAARWREMVVGLENQG